MSRDVWPEIEPWLSSVERPSRYLDHERGARRKPDADYRCVLIYPDVYEIGISNLGLAILYHALNDMPDIACERGFLPWTDLIDIMRAHDIPLFALESYDAVGDFDVVGFTLPYELAITNVLEALDLAHIPQLSVERGEDDPLVIAGGPCTYNPEPFADFFDVFLIGEGEEEIVEFAREHRRLRDEGASRSEMLHALAHVSGAYVPSLYVASEEGAGTAPSTSWPLDDDAWPQVAGPLMAPASPDAPPV
ncbi:MAG: B12-binding domain-containing radical SAM protein, partial [Coriobacteriales bacterium]